MANLNDLKAFLSTLKTPDDLRAARKLISEQTAELSARVRLQEEAARRAKAQETMVNNLGRGLALLWNQAATIGCSKPAMKTAYLGMLESLGVQGEHLAGISQAASVKHGAPRKTEKSAKAASAKGK